MNDHMDFRGIYVYWTTDTITCPVLLWMTKFTLSHFTRQSL